jgi:hypothetical protein
MASPFLVKFFRVSVLAQTLHLKHAKKKLEKNKKMERFFFLHQQQDKEANTVPLCHTTDPSLTCSIGLQTKRTSEDFFFLFFFCSSFVFYFHLIQTTHPLAYTNTPMTET